MQMFGLIREIIGEQGFAWNRRLQMLQPLMNAPGMEEVAGRLGDKYGYSDAAAAVSVVRCLFLACFRTDRGPQYRPKSEPDPRLDLAVQGVLVSVSLCQGLLRYAGLRDGLA